MSNPADIKDSNISNLLEQAGNGDRDSMNNLAIYYKDVEKNFEKAFYWYQKVADNGDDSAMYNLAACYENGEGTEKNLEKAFYWHQKAAENGNYSNAMNDFATLYYNGEGIEKNSEKAVYWYQKAAQKDLIDAQYNLALLYHTGE